MIDIITTLCVKMTQIYKVKRLTEIMKIITLRQSTQSIRFYKISIQLSLFHFAGYCNIIFRFADGYIVYPVLLRQIEVKGTINIIHISCPIFLYLFLSLPPFFNNPQNHKCRHYNKYCR